MRKQEGSSEDQLQLRVFRLNTLYELNQEISTLRNMHEVLETSLLYIMGVFGLRSMIIAIYKDQEKFPHEFVCRGIDENAQRRWFQQLETHLGSSYILEICVADDASESPLSQLLKVYQFCVWLPLEIDEETWGGIALGKKLLEEDFAPDDLELLYTIAINIQNVLSNVSMIEALNQAVIKETRIRNVFQRYAPQPVISEVLNPSNEELLLGESEEVRSMFDQMIDRLTEKHILEQDLELAYDVQKYLLPHEAPVLSGIQIAARSLPARGVCGDLYDFIPLSPHELGVSLADVSGKGMPAAMISAMLQSATRMCVGSYYPIPAILSILNRFLYRHTEAMHYATMFYGQINAQGRIFTYSNAGHPPAILYRDRKLRYLETGGPVVGVLDNSSYEQDTIDLKSGDVMVIYSDGVTDAGTTPESLTFDDSFGQERLEAAIIENAHLSANMIMDAISNRVLQHVGDNKQFDDITMIVMKVD